MISRLHRGVPEEISQRLDTFLLVWGARLHSDLLSLQKQQETNPPLISRYKLPSFVTIHDDPRIWVLRE